MVWTPLNESYPYIREKRGTLMREITGRLMRETALRPWEETAQAPVEWSDSSVDERPWEPV